jgi:3-hydroxymyristoyl/3-hydroxydecanoyl-(acyl carrier protein) dehydratase
VSEFSIAREFRVPAAHACFSAHFPGRPLVPGALLLQWLCREVVQQFPDYRVVAVPSMKFTQPLLPADICQLNLRCELPLAQVRVKLLRAGETVCHGILDLLHSQDAPL